MSYAPRKTHETSHPTTDESTGEITSDSLAAESLNSGGHFAGGHASISGQKSVGSTAANTDTTNATTLSPARDAEARLTTESASLNSSKKGEYTTVRGTGSAHTITQAPSSMGRDTSEGEKPKGKNLTEGGFDAGAPNASSAAIGSKRDPARVAELDFQKKNARGGGLGTRGEGGTDKGQYGLLGREEDV